MNQVVPISLLFVASAYRTKVNSLLGSHGLNDTTKPLCGVIMSPHHMAVRNYMPNSLTWVAHVFLIGHLSLQAYLQHDLITLMDVRDQDLGTRGTK